jgi:hypothetical protein
LRQRALRPQLKRDPLGTHDDSMGTQPVPSLRRVYITAAACAFFAAAYAALRVEPPPFVLLVAYYATPVSVVLWLQRDARFQRVTAVQDWGMLAFITWPVMIPWYAIKTRGVGVGLPLAACLLLPVLVPPITFALVTLVRGRS